MHAYSIDSDERRNVTIILALLGIGAAYVLNRALDASDVAIPWWLDAPAAFGFSAFFYALFEQWGWRLDLWSTIRLVAAPDLSGQWSGHVASSLDSHGASHRVLVEVKQTWTRISVVLITETSRSCSIVAGLCTKGPAGPELTYTYRNEPLPQAVGTMNIHYGTATMRLSEQGLRLGGDYYSGRGRETYGSITVRRSG